MAKHEFVLFLIDNIIRDPDVMKYRRIQKSHPLLDDESIRDIIENDLGFFHTQTSLVLPEPDLQRLGRVRESLARERDALLDPESITFAQVAEILQRNGTLPGINQDIADEPLHSDVVPFSDASGGPERPKKPWETPS
jgi:hypothetical protein